LIKCYNLQSGVQTNQEDLVFNRYQEILERRSRHDENSKGFTLIELLIVILVLGILAAIVIFALGGVTGQSAQAACKTDARSVETGIAAALASSSPPSTVGTADLLTSVSGGPYLQGWPTSSHYTISISTDGTNKVMVLPKGSTAAVAYNNGAGCAGVS
jgi:general secretion pathway protein G